MKMSFTNGLGEGRGYMNDMNENTNKLTDPAILERIKAIEASPEYQQKLEEIKRKMTGNAEKRMLGIVAIIIGGVILHEMTDHFIYIMILIAIFVWPRLQKFQDANDISYVDNFLLPVLREALPNAKIDYNSGIEIPLLELATPSSRYYDRNCHIVFGDEMQTEFCNLYSYHKEEEDGKMKRFRDFSGQVLLSKYKTNLNGYIRIVPTKKSFWGGESHHGYDGKSKNEVQLEMEDIHFNENYNVYCTDELSARMLLNPYMLEILDEWSKHVSVAVYMNEDTVIVSFYSGRQILQAPNFTGGIEELSLSSEYEKIQAKLIDLYRLLDTLNHQI